MGIGECQQESDEKTLEEGCFLPLKDKDPEKAAYNPIQECLVPLKDKIPEKDAYNPKQGCLVPLKNKIPVNAAYNPKEGCLVPLKDKDPEKDAYNPKQGICQKLRSLKVPLIYVVVGSAILLPVIIIPAVLHGKGEKPETEVVKSSTAAVCLDGCVLYGKKCYYISDQIDTWNNSQNFCKSHDSSLAIIDDEKEMNFLKLLRANKYWIGLSRAKDNSGWVWADGKSYSETIFEILRKPAGNDESENVYLNGEGFRSESGRYAKKWICSKNFLARSGNYNCELPEILQGEKPETEVVKSSTAAVCLDDWVLYGKKCYYISDRMDTWNNSQNFCKSYDSSLTIIDDEKEMNFLNLLRANKYWIGLSRAKDDSSWVWADGKSYSGTIVESHRKPPGNDESENVYLNGDGLRSESGRYPKKWICSHSFLGHSS